MPAPAITDLFGANAVVDTTDAANPELRIKFADFSAQGFGNVAKTSDAEAWVVALIKKWRSQTVAATDEASNIAVDAPFLGLTTRNSVSVREYSYSARVYEPDTGASEPDPDNV